jgi:hypothetical protein
LRTGQRKPADEFIAWAMHQPEGERYELVAGEVVSMVPERVAHGRAKDRIAKRLAEAVEVAHLECEYSAMGQASRWTPIRSMSPTRWSAAGVLGRQCDQSLRLGCRQGGTT